jgi:DNA-directed RNA polymerase subunit RPC12/RpoP
MSNYYRKQAREALGRAKNQAANDALEYLRYSALEICSAMEAVIFDRALLYKDWISPTTYREWDPRAVLAYLVDIDADADMLTVPLTNPNENDEIQISQAQFEDVYQRLNSYIHLPQMSARRSQSRDYAAGLKRHLQECIKIVEQLLSSPYRDSLTGVFASRVCARCGNTVTRRLPEPEHGIVETRCTNCGAPHGLGIKGDNDIVWHPLLATIQCDHRGCDRSFRIWLDEIQPGVSWQCEGCGQRWIIQLSPTKIKIESGNRQEKDNDD